MKRNLRLLLVIPLIIFFASVLIVFFSPVDILPCETSAVDPATTWDKSKCKGYYLTTNPVVSQPVENVNNSGFLINLTILICGSFLFNGILFLILFAVVSIQKPKSKLEEWDEIAEDAEEMEKPKYQKRGLFSQMLKKDKPFEERFENEEPPKDNSENDDI
ncbi:MAG: hypothetical protein ACMG57_01370 [Candidatus Dojkabacteria bacterium]